MLNIVTISSSRYLLDTGFGSSGPSFPLPLKPDQVHKNVGPQTNRLTLINIPNATNKHPDQKLWEYSYRNGEDQDWTPAYCFTETEFMPEDYTVMSHYTSTSKASWFTYAVVCVKMVLGEKKANYSNGTNGASRSNGAGGARDIIENGSNGTSKLLDVEIVGDVTLFGTDIRKRIDGKSEPIATLDSEEARINALKEHLGISLSAPERAGIRNMCTEIM